MLPISRFYGAKQDIWINVLLLCMVLVATSCKAISLKELEISNSCKTAFFASTSAIPLNIYHAERSGRKRIVINTCTWYVPIHNPFQRLADKSLNCKKFCGKCKHFTSPRWIKPLGSFASTPFPTPRLKNGDNTDGFYSPFVDNNEKDAEIDESTLRDFYLNDNAFLLSSFITPQVEATHPLDVEHTLQTPRLLATSTKSIKVPFDGAKNAFRSELKHSSLKRNEEGALDRTHENARGPEVSKLRVRSNLQRNQSFLYSESLKLNEKLLQAKGALEILNIIDECRRNKAYFNHVNCITAFHRFAKCVRNKKFGNLQEIAFQIKDALVHNDTLPVAQSEEFGKNRTLVSPQNKDQGILTVYNAPPQTFLYQSSKFRNLLEMVKGELRASTNLQSMHVANAAWAIAVLDIKDAEFWELLGQQICRLKQSFKPQEVSIILWSMATTKSTADAGIIEILLSLISSFLISHKLKPQEICNTVWAIITMKIQNFQIVSQLIEEALSIAHKMAPIDITTLTYSLSLHGHGALGLLKRFLKYTICDWYDSFTRPNKPALSLESKNIPPESCIFEIEKYFADNLKSMRQTRASCRSDLCLPLWKPTFATVRVASPRNNRMQQHRQLVPANNSSSCSNFDKLMLFSAQDWSNLVWSCATSGVGIENTPKHAIYYRRNNLPTEHKPFNDFSNLFQKSDSSTNSMVNRSFGTMPEVNAFASAHDRNVELPLVKITNFLYFQILCKKRQWSDFSSQSLANLLWGFSVMNYFPKELFEAGIKEAALRNASPHEFPRNTKDLAPRHQAQLFQALLAYALAIREQKQHGFGARNNNSLLKSVDVNELLKSAGINFPSEVLKEWQLQLARAQKRIRKKQNLSSALHRSISKDLKQLNIPHENEYFIAESFIADIVFPNKQLILEVYGPSHFWDLEDVSVLTPRTLLKQRILKQLGWEVVSVPYFFYEEANSTAVDAKGRIKCLLDTLQASHL